MPSNEINNFGGTQTLTLDYAEQGKAKPVNRINHKLIPKGIYEGGEVLYVNGTTMSINPLVAFLPDNVSNVAIRVETDTLQEIGVDVNFPYLVLRHIWDDTENNWTSLINVAFNPDPETHTNAELFWDSDIIIGKVVYIDGVLQSELDYSRATKSVIKETEISIEKFKVLPTEPYSNSVDVNSGNVMIEGNYIQFAGGNITLTDNTSGSDRTDIVFLDSSGVLTVTENTSIFPHGVLALALITRADTRDEISGIEITNIKSDRIVDINRTHVHSGSISDRVEYTDLLSIPNVTNDGITTPNTILKTDVNGHVKVSGLEVTNILANVNFQNKNLNNAQIVDCEYLDATYLNKNLNGNQKDLTNLNSIQAINGYTNLCQNGSSVRISKNITGRADNIYYMNRTIYVTTDTFIKIFLHTDTARIFELYIDGLFASQYSFSSPSKGQGFSQKYDSFFLPKGHSYFIDAHESAGTTALYKVLVLESQLGR